MPKRTEIELSPSHWQRLSQLAKRRKKSVSQLIADAVEQYLQREQQSDWEERKRRTLAAVGRFPAASDLAEKHDEYYTNREDTVYKNKRD
jgi:predicted transcriptional regulator